MKTNGERLAAGLFLVVLVLIGFSPAFRAGFIVDDDNYVTENRALRDSAGLKRIWFEQGATPQYYPLVYTSFWLEYQIWDLRPLGYHAVNILLHVLNALLLWLLLSRLSIPGAWFIAAVFAVHPVQVESVAWITERKNVLSGAFYLLSALTYLRFDCPSFSRESAKRSWTFYVLSLSLFLAALLCKTATVSLPAALLLMIWWKRRRLSISNVAPLAPMFMAGIAMSLLTIRIETTRGGAVGEIWDLSWVERVLIAARSAWFYFGKMLWPVNLSFNYEKWDIDSVEIWPYLLAFIALALLIVLWTLRNRMGRGPLVSVLFFLGTLLPVLGFFNVYYFRYSYVADHFLYLAGIGLIGLATVVGRSLLRTLPGAGTARFSVVGGLILAVLLGLTWNRARAFESLETLCLDTLKKNPSSWLARNNLGNIHLRRGEIEESIDHFKQAADLAPTYLETHLNLAIAMMNLGHYDESREHAGRAMEIEPLNHFAYNLLGESYLREGRPLDAVPWFRESLVRDPDYVKAQSNLALSLTQAGRPFEALPWFETALKSDPAHVTLLANYAIALANLGRYHDAVEQLEKALRLSPHNESLIHNLDIVRQEMSARSTGE